MKYTIYKLHFNKGVRFGKGKIDEAMIGFHADTLFSTIINEAAKYDEEVLNRFIREAAQGRLRFTDAFPFIGEELTLPKPLLHVERNESDTSLKKKLKNIDYIPFSLWEKYLQGAMNPESAEKLLDSLGRFQTDSKIQYRDDGQHQPYNIQYYRFYPGNGVYFILGFEEEDLQEEIDELLYNLSFTGIGGKRSIGLGRFETINEDLPEALLSRIRSHQANMLLTSSMASEEELEGILESPANYLLEKRAGFIYSEDKAGSGQRTLRKKTMHFFRAGSTFQKRFEGNLFRVDHDFIHPVYRFSKPIWMEVTP